MNKELRQKILKELKSLLNEQLDKVPRGANSNNVKNKSEEIAGNILSSSVDIKRGKYKVVNATGFTDNVTEEELKTYISSPTNPEANKKLCSIGGQYGLIIVDGTGIYADSMVLVTCKNGIPSSHTLGGSATTVGQVESEVNKFVKQYKLDSNTGTSDISASPTNSESEKALGAMDAWYDPNFGKKGLSFKCPTDTEKDSIVAKFQRYVGANPDGQFGKQTYSKAIAKQIKFGSNWEEYRFIKGAVEKLCGWLKAEGQPWSKLDGKVVATRRPTKKKSINEKPPGLPGDQGPDPTPAGPPPSPGSGAKGAGRPVEESNRSKDFYEKKKLNESKKLFNKLLKEL